MKDSYVGMIKKFEGLNPGTIITACVAEVEKVNDNVIFNIHNLDVHPYSKYGIRYATVEWSSSFTGTGIPSFWSVADTVTVSDSNNGIIGNDNYLSIITANIPVDEKKYKFRISFINTNGSKALFISDYDKYLSNENIGGSILSNVFTPTISGATNNIYPGFTVLPVNASDSEIYASKDIVWDSTNVLKLSDGNAGIYNIKDNISVGIRISPSNYFYVQGNSGDGILIDDIDYTDIMPGVIDLNAQILETTWITGDSVLPYSLNGNSLRLRFENSIGHPSATVKHTDGSISSVSSSEWDTSSEYVVFVRITDNAQYATASNAYPALTSQEQSAGVKWYVFDTFPVSVIRFKSKRYETITLRDLPSERYISVFVAVKTRHAIAANTDEIMPLKSSSKYTHMPTGGLVAS